MEDGAELSVRSAKLQSFPPFPTWNGTVAAPPGDDRGLCSVLGAGGELVVLQNSRRKDDEHDSKGSCLRVCKVLPAAEEKVASFCQCWASDGSVVATAHNRTVAIYSGEDFRELVKLQLRFNVVSMDITKGRSRDGEDIDSFFFIVGTASGALLYKVKLPCERADADGECEAEQELMHVARIHADVAVCLVKFSGDGSTAAIGTMDGRLFLRRLSTRDDQELATFGTAVLSKVLAAPRVTSMSFSACSTKLVVATRKGNVYVFTRASDTGKWQTLSSCKDLSANPKPKPSGAAGVSKAATAAQTLVTCWGPVFVVCSRAITSRLEMYDFASGCLLHSLQLAPAAASSSSTTLNTWVDQQLVTGVCVLQDKGGGSSRLVCHDTSTNLALVAWPFLDAMNGRLSTHMNGR